jgi:hypothetical protein
MGEVTFGWIRNTLELGQLGISENLKTEVDQDPALEVLGPACDLQFDVDGNLVRPYFWDTKNDKAKAMGTNAGPDGSTRK